MISSDKEETCYVCGAVADPTVIQDTEHYGRPPAGRGFCSDACRDALYAATDAARSS